MSDELRECPSCRGRAYSDTRAGAIFRIRCNDCDMTTGAYTRFEAAATAWNTRASDARIAELEAGLRRVLYANPSTPGYSEAVDHATALLAKSGL